MVTNASETWRFRKLEEKIITTWERKILKRISDLRRSDGIWKKITNKELTELYNNADIVAEIGSRRTAWMET
jgi:uncharacterized coiled-coil DUF342 family protein